MGGLAQNLRLLRAKGSYRDLCNQLTPHLAHLAGSGAPLQAVIRDVPNPG